MLILPSQTNTATKNLLVVDLKLDDRLQPTSFQQFQKTSPPPIPSKSVVDILEDGPSSTKFSHAVGSAKDDEFLYYRYASIGLFGAVYEAWLNHWALRTSPEDWWFPVALKIAEAVDTAAKYGKWPISHVIRENEIPTEKGSHCNVSGGARYEKRDINIETDTVRIDYKKIFATIKTQMRESVKVPEFIDAMENNFSTSTETHTIASQINLMSCFKEYFNFNLYSLPRDGCGLKGLEMDGTVKDWEELAVKLKTVRDILKPFGIWELSDRWWEAVHNVFEMLAFTRKNPNDPKVAGFWINILCNTKGKQWIGGGGSVPTRFVEVPVYNGWLIQFLLDKDEIFAEDLQKKEIRQALYSWNQVPLIMTLKWHQPPITDICTLISGIAGYKIHAGEGNNKENSEDGDVVPSVEPHHMWALLLKRNSPLQSHRLALDRYP